MSIDQRVQVVLEKAGVQPGELRNKDKFDRVNAVLDGIHCDCKHLIRAKLREMHCAKVSIELAAAA